MIAYNPHLRNPSPCFPSEALTLRVGQIKTTDVYERTINVFSFYWIRTPSPPHVYVIHPFVFVGSFHGFPQPSLTLPLFPVPHGHPSATLSSDAWARLTNTGRCGLLAPNS